MTYRIYLLLSIFVTGCTLPDRSDEDRSADRQTFSQQNRDQAVRKKTTRQDYRLWHTVDQFDLSGFKYYGEFYNKRLRFFYALQPEISMGPAQVSLIMLYFLDNRLVKIRYHLDRDLSAFILDSLGYGVLNTRYTRHKSIRASITALKKLKDYSDMNGNPDDYEIFWDRNIIESRYKVNTYPSGLYSFDTVNARFVYIDQLASYKKELLLVETDLRRRDTANQ